MGLCRLQSLRARAPVTLPTYPPHIHPKPHGTLPVVTCTIQRALPRSCLCGSLSMTISLSGMSSLVSTTQNSSSLTLSLIFTSTLRVAGDNSVMLTTSMDLKVMLNLSTTSTNCRLSLGTRCMLSTSGALRATLRVFLSSLVSLPE
jgi:hypothetical protein